MVFELTEGQKIIENNHVCVTCGAKTILVRDPKRVWIRYNPDGTEHWHFLGAGDERRTMKQISQN